MQTLTRASIIFSIPDIIAHEHKSDSSKRVVHPVSKNFGQSITASASFDFSWRLLDNNDKTHFHVRTYTSKYFCLLWPIILQLRMKIHIFCTPQTLFRAERHYCEQRYNERKCILIALLKSPSAHNDREKEIDARPATSYSLSTV